MVSISEKNKISKEVRQAAVEHLCSRTAKEALSHFTKDIIAVSNEKLFPSYAILAKDVEDYYNILKEINIASWDDIRIQVINKNAATFTARFHYQFTSIEDMIIDLKGIWTALFVRQNKNWKIRLRHESFSQS
jgi:hypothetical protein